VDNCSTWRVVLKVKLGNAGKGISIIHGTEIHSYMLVMILWLLLTIVIALKLLPSALGSELPGQCF
jgi:hypothetical protein